MFALASYETNLSMVIVQVLGGLGNQLFQYAMGRAVAYCNNIPLKLDNSEFDNYSLRKYKLHHFNISSPLASPAEIGYLTGTRRKGIQAKIYALAQWCMPYYRRSVFIESQPQYDPNVLKITGKVYLKGYWHSEKYFKDIEKIIHKEFTLKKSLQGRYAKMATRIQACNSVSLHIRRGDYITNEENRQKYSYFSQEFYSSAAMRIKETVRHPRFFVFSDDITWAHENLHLPDHVIFVDHTKENQDYEDLRLMSLCDHHIIANSSFSWWGAWLGRNPQKIVVSPRNWFNDPHRDTRDLIPKTWLRM